MREITTDDQSKDILVAITTIVNSNRGDKSVKVNFYYYQRGMDNFIKINPEIVDMPQLKGKSKNIDSVNLDVNHVHSFLKNKEKSFVLSGALTDNKVANVLLINDDSKEVSARLIFKQNSNIY